MKPYKKVIIHLLPDGQVSYMDLHTHDGEILTALQGTIYGTPDNELDLAIIYAQQKADTYEVEQ